MNLGEHEGPEDTIYWLDYAESDRVIVNIESWFRRERVARWKYRTVGILIVTFVGKI